jgi:hypothetical protein
MSPTNPMERKQRSTFWLWMTLWLTATIDAVLLYLLLAAIVLFLLHVALLGIVALGLLLVAYATGAYLSVRWVLKRSIIPKVSANKIAFLAIIIPLIGSVCFVLFGVYSNLSNGRGLSVIGVGTTVLWDALTLGIVYFIIRSYISTKGD